MKTTSQLRQTHSRRGSMVVIAAVLLVVVFAITAFVVDVGYISLARNQLQKTADAAALAGALEFPEAFGKGATLTTQEMTTVVRTAAIDTGAANSTAGRDTTYINGPRDVRLGRYIYGDGAFTTTWNTAPYNLIEVTVRRNQTGSTNGDDPLDLFFAPVIGSETANTQTVSRAALFPGVGFKIDSNNSATAGALPIALDNPTWTALLAGTTGTDQYRYNETTGAVTAGTDGIKEVNLYPNGTASLPPGNRGMVDLGSPSNSTADIARQILYGLNEEDLSYFPNNEIRFDNGPITLNGDTGISAGVKDELTAIIGQPRAIPIFTAVSGPGNNAMYTVPKFVGIRIMYVKLTGQPNGKKVLIQPAPFSDSSIITSHTATVTTDSIWGAASLVK